MTDSCLLARVARARQYGNHCPLCTCCYRPRVRRRLVVRRSDANSKRTEYPHQSRRSSSSNLKADASAPSPASRDTVSSSLLSVGFGTLAMYWQRSGGGHLATSRCPARSSLFVTLRRRQGSSPSLTSCIVTNGGSGHLVRPLRLRGLVHVTVAVMFTVEAVSLSSLPPSPEGSVGRHGDLSTLHRSSCTACPHGPAQPQHVNLTSQLCLS